MVSAARANLFEERTEFVVLWGRRQHLGGPLVDPSLDPDRVL
jgi:hypothetical protein